MKLNAFDRRLKRDAVLSHYLGVSMVLTKRPLPGSLQYAVCYTDALQSVLFVFSLQYLKLSYLLEVLGQVRQT